jgi:hypothetical protein
VLNLEVNRNSFCTLGDGWMIGSAMNRSRLWKSALFAGAALVWCAPVVRADYALAADTETVNFAAPESAHEAEPPPVSFSDPVSAMQAASPARARLAAPTPGGAHETQNPALAEENGESGPREVEVEFAAGRERTGIGLDISVAQRASFAANAEGDISRAGQASELRLGRGLTREARGNGSSWFVFAASEDESLTWQPGGDASRGGQGAAFGVRDRVEIGDMQAGVTYEHGPLQASLAYVEREVSVETGFDSSISRDESFTGLTLTMRH